MAMDEFAQLYGNLRAAVLSRHFAINNRFRTNFLLDTNGLQGSPNSEVDRWRVITRDGDNPLLIGGRLMTCLAVEYYLGRHDVLRIIHAFLDTMGSLYKFQGDHFDGYIIRWDPVLRDGEWVDDGERTYCRAFYLNQDLGYNYSTPIHEPRSRRPLTRAEWDAASPEERQRHGEAFMDWQGRVRNWEPSMDELVGLVMSYHMVHELVDDVSVRQKVQDQTMKLADYLAEHSHFLVRPGGGFSARGASGVSPALEYPFGRVFEPITNQPYHSRNSFAAVMAKADAWGALAEPFAWWSVMGIAASGLLPLITEVLVPIGLGALLLGPSPLFTLAQRGQIWAIYLHRDVFDVLVGYDAQRYNDSAQGEFALAYALSQVNPPEVRFGLYMAGAGTALAQGHSAWFPPFLGLMGVKRNFQADDPLIRAAYFNWLQSRRANTGIIDEVDAISSAVGAVLGAGAGEEAELVRLLQEHRSTIGGLGDALPVLEDPVREDVYPLAVDYMVGLALAWLHRKRCEDRGQSVSPADFPALPDNSSWPLAVVPADVLAEARGGTLALPLNAIQRNQPLQLTPQGAADLFYDNPVVPKSPVPLAVLPNPPRRLIYDRTISVSESAADVRTGIRLRMGDEFEITASGRIRAGPWPFFDENGPNGENRIDYDRKFFLTGQPNGHPYCLLGKLGDNGAYFFIGQHRLRERYLGEETRELFLRINDDSPGNGEGAFTCRVRVWGPPLLNIVDFKALSFVFFLVPSVWFRVLSPVHGRARITLTVSKDGGPFYVVRSEDPYGGLPPDIVGDWQRREVSTNTPAPWYLFWLGGTKGGPNYRNRNGTYEFRIGATDVGGGASDELSTKVFIEWHGSRITCINKKPRRDTTRAIQFFGGLTSDGRNWRLSLAEAIAEVESGQEFYVEQPQGDRVEVVVAVSARGHKYLKTVADGDEPNNLLSLPECT